MVVACCFELCVLLKCCFAGFCGWGWAGCALEVFCLCCLLGVFVLGLLLLVASCCLCFGVLILICGFGFIVGDCFTAGLLWVMVF